MYITNGQDTFIKLPVLQFIYSYLAYLAKIIKVYNIGSLIKRIVKTLFRKRNNESELFFQQKTIFLKRNNESEFFFYQEMSPISGY